jgi:hypothetical protein
MKKLIVLVIILLSPVVMGWGQDTKGGHTYAAEQEEQDNRSIRFGEREIQLRQLLRIDETNLETAAIENEIARRDGTPQDLTRFEINRFLVAQDKIAIKVSNLLARVWYRSGNKELQPKLFDIEKQLFDEAHKKCNYQSKDPIYFHLEDAENACADLDQIYETVSHYEIKGELVPSFFAESSTSPKMYAKWLRADILQLKKDSATIIPAKIQIRNEKEKLILDDQSLIDVDEMIWNITLIDETVVKHNKAHPDDPLASTTEFTQNLTEKVTSLRQSTIKHAEAIREEIKAELNLARLSR